MDWETICGPDGLVPWSERSSWLGSCFSQLVFDVPSAVVLTAVSSYYVGKECNFVIRSRAQNAVLFVRALVCFGKTPGTPVFFVVTFVPDDGIFDGGTRPDGAGAGRRGVAGVRRTAAGRRAGGLLRRLGLAVARRLRGRAEAARLPQSARSAAGAGRLDADRADHSGPFQGAIPWWRSLFCFFFISVAFFFLFFRTEGLAGGRRTGGRGRGPGRSAAALLGDAAAAGAGRGRRRFGLDLPIVGRREREPAPRLPVGPP